MIYPLLYRRRILLATILIAIFVLCYAVYKRQPVVAEQPALLLAPVCATIGWILTIYVGRSNERRKFTIDLVLRHQMDRTFEDHKIRILKTYPPFSQLSTDDAAAVQSDYRKWTVEGQPAENDEIPVGYSIVQMLNFYEFVAVGVRKGRLDESVALDAFRALSRNMISKFIPLIRLSRPMANDGSRPKTYCHLQWLSQRWHKLDIDMAADPVRAAKPITKSSGGEVVVQSKPD